MGYKSTSTRRTSAASAVSSQSVVVNTPGGFSAVGATIKSNTSISLGVTTAGQTSAATITTVSAGPAISNVAYLDANNSVTSANAVSTSGGNIRITGTGFVANSAVYINNTLATNTFVSSTQIIATCPAASAGNVAIMIFTPTDTGTQKANAVRYSGAPTWTTAAASLQNGIAANVSLVASSDSTLTYTLQDGSTLPTGISLNSAGYLTGTPTGYSGSASVTVVIIATDAEGQAAQQTINISVTTGDDQFKYTTLLLNGETSVTPFIKDSSSNNFGLTLAGDVRADRFSPYYGDGYYSNYLSSTSTGFTNTSVTHGLAGNFTIEFWHYPTVAMTSGTYYYMAGASTGPLIAMTGGVIGFAHQGGFSVTGSAGVVQGQWNHIACVRLGTTVTVYLNGVSVGSGTDATNFSPAQTYGYGVANNGTSGSAGYISNFRITDGQALYTGTFTPSTAPLTTTSVGATGANVAASLTGTVTFLGFQSSRFIDKSSTNTALTAAGTPTVSPAIPFAANAAYATYGSMYVPTAVTNYLALPHTAATTITSGSTDSFIAECWVYFNSATASTAIMDQSGANTVTFQNWSIGLDGSKQFQIIWGGTGSPGSQIGYISGTTVARSGVWYHLAYVKTNAVWSLFVNGVRETTYSGLNTASDGTTNPLRIGSDTFSSQSINGYIADVRVYKGATAGAPYDASSSTITIPTAPLAAVTNTQLLTCQYNGGTNNSGIVDDGPLNNVVTRVGNTTQGTFSPYSQTGWSNYFVTSGNYISTPATHAAFAATSQDFTLECWVYLTAAPGTHAMVCGWGNTNFDYLELTNSGFDTNMNNTYTVGANFSWALGTWYHIAISRVSNVNYCFVNGNLIGSGITNSQSFGSGATAMRIGDWVTTPRYPFPGYISNFRFIAGTGLYNASFTPSATPLTAVANTKLLTCQSNGFKDNSSNAYAVTVTGTPSVQAFSPFSPSAAYTPSLHGGSAYFDGTGDNITVGTAPVTLPTATTPFTMEAWVYVTAFTGVSIIATNYSSGAIPFMLGMNSGTNNTTTSGGYPVMYHYSGSAWNYVVQSTSANSTALKLNTWYHIAGVYTGSAATIYVNGTATVTAAVSTWTTTASAAGGINVGRKWDTSTGAYFSGYISDPRLVIGTAVYTTNFTPPTAPLLPTANTNFLCNFADGGIVDAHSSNNVETVGNAQVSTAVKKYGNASMYFGGSQSLLFPGSSIPGGAGSAFTVEFWINAPSVNSLTIMRANGNASSLSLSTSASGQLIVSNVFAADFYTSTSTLSPNVWTHVAIVRSSSNLYTIYFNGVSAGTAVTYATSIGTATQMYIAYNTYTTGYSTFYLDDFRVTNGFARYTANFTPPSTGHLGQ